MVIPPICPFISSGWEHRQPADNEHPPLGDWWPTFLPTAHHMVQTYLLCSEADALSYQTTLVVQRDKENNPSMSHSDLTRPHCSIYPHLTNATNHSTDKVGRALWVTWTNPMPEQGGPQELVCWLCFHTNYSNHSLSPHLFSFYFPL